MKGWRAAPKKEICHFRLMASSIGVSSGLADKSADLVLGCIRHSISSWSREGGHCPALHLGGLTLKIVSSFGNLSTRRHQISVCLEKGGQDCERPWAQNLQGVTEATWFILCERRRLRDDVTTVCNLLKKGSRRAGAGLSLVTLKRDEAVLGGAQARH